MNVPNNKITNEGKVLVGQFLKSQRKTKGLKQIDIANEVGYDAVNFISLIEKGQSKIPFEKIDTFAKAYKLDFFEFAMFVIDNSYPNCRKIINKIICGADINK